MELSVYAFTALRGAELSVKSYLKCIRVQKVALVLNYVSLVKVHSKRASCEFLVFEGHQEVLN